MFTVLLRNRATGRESLRSVEAFEFIPKKPDSPDLEKSKLANGYNSTIAGFTLIHELRNKDLDKPTRTTHFKFEDGINGCNGLDVFVMNEAGATVAKYTL